jgi:quercetin dioxygenase-like cupin family protein
MKHKMLTLIALVVAVAMLATGAAIATPGSGVTFASILARGTLADHFKITLRDSSTPGDVVVQQITIAPTGYTGWHTHPGPAVVIVKSGSLTLYDGDDRSCTGTTYSAGQVFVDPGYGHVHFGRNEGATPTELVVTYLDVPVGAAPRTDAPDPGNCAF